MSRKNISLEFRQDPLNAMREAAAHDWLELPYGVLGDLWARLWRSSRRLYLLNNSEDIRHVLVTRQKNYRRTIWPPSLRIALCRGLLTTDETFHLRQRRMMQPLFAPPRVAAYAALIVEETERAMRSWKDGAEVDMHREMRLLTFTVIARALGLDFGHDKESFSEAALEGEDFMSRQSSSPLGILPLQMLKGVWAYLKLNRRVIRVILDRRQDAAEATDILAGLLKAKDERGRPMGDREIRDEVVTLLLAGHMTTVNALSWALHLLSKNPPCQEALTAELDSVLADRPAGAEDYSRLEYASMVLYETLRLYPPSWLLAPRLAVVSDELPSGLRLPGNSLLWISPYSLHRRAKYFPDPESFRPERFSRDKRRFIDPGSFIPFGLGVRGCIGEHFAMLEGVLVLATIARRFIVEPSPQTEPVPEPLITLRPKGGLRLRVRSHSVLRV